ncbi:hypothetical protein CMMCAS05_14045 [Clavibacter michiganensis subsp. michiganensis]|nr:hypothetical protein CMMCAS05_14045 [Clavibacter michiganensis subsp. michiganensis]
MPHGVGEALAHHGLHVVEQVARHHLVDVAVEHDARRRREGHGDLAHHVEQPVAGAHRARLAGAQREHGGADLGDRVVEQRLHRLDPGVDGGRDRVHVHPVQRQACGEQALDHVVVQVACDPPAVLQQGDALAGRAGVAQLEGDAGVGGEVGDEVEVEVDEPGGSGGARHDERRVEAAGPGERHRDRAAGGALAVGGSGVREPQRERRHARRDDAGGRRPLGAEHPAHVVGRVLAPRVLGRERAGRGAGDDRDDGCVGQPDHRRRDEPERVVAVLVEQRRRDLRLRERPALPPLRLAEQAGVVDGDARGGGERHQQLLVLGAERARGVLGEVEVPVHLVAHADRDAEERVHRRVVRGEAGGAGVVGEVLAAHGMRVVDEGAEHAETARQVADALGEVGVDAHVDELLQPSVRPDDAEGAVARADEIDRGLGDAPQHVLEVEVLGDGARGGEQVPEPALRLEHVARLLDEVGDGPLQRRSGQVGESHDGVGAHVQPLPGPGIHGTSGPTPPGRAARRSKPSTR